MLRENLLTDHRFAWVCTEDLVRFLCQYGDWGFEPTPEYLTSELLALKLNAEQGRRGLRREYHWQMGHQLSVLAKMPIYKSFDAKPYLIWHNYRVLDFLLEHTNLVAGVSVPRMLAHCPKCGVNNGYKNNEWCGVFPDCPLKLSHA